MLETLVSTIIVSKTKGPPTYLLNNKIVLWDRGYKLLSLCYFEATVLVFLKLYVYMGCWAQWFNGLPFDGCWAHLSSSSCSSYGSIGNDLSLMICMVLLGWVSVGWIFSFCCLASCSMRLFSFGGSPLHFVN